MQTNHSLLIVPSTFCITEQTNFCCICDDMVTWGRFDDCIYCCVQLSMCGRRKTPRIYTYLSFHMGVQVSIVSVVDIVYLILIILKENNPLFIVPCLYFHFLIKSIPFYHHLHLSISLFVFVLFPSVSSLIDSPWSQLATSPQTP